jgi:hypothetical protein
MAEGLSAWAFQISAPSAALTFNFIALRVDFQEAKAALLLGALRALARQRRTRK